VGVGRLTSADLRNPLHLLLDFSWAGRTLRLAQQTLHPPVGLGGATVTYYPGFELSGDVVDPYVVGDQAAGGISVQMKLHVQPGINVPALVAQGHVLGSAQGTLWLWAEGTGHRVKLLEGVFQEVTWDTASTAIVGILEELPVMDDAAFPDRRARASIYTWANHDLAISGLPYPWVFGSPGVAGRTRGATPAILVDTTGSGRLVINGERVGASHAEVFQPQGGGSVVIPVTHTTDLLGREVATIAPIAPITLVGGNRYWVQWIDGSGADTFGTMENGRPVRGAGDVIEWMLKRSHLRWDSGRLAAVKPLLNQYLIDTYIQADTYEPVVPWAWVEANLLPILPVSPRIGPDGLFLAFWNFAATKDHAVADLVAGPGGNCEPASDVAYTPLSRVASTVELGHSWDVERGDVVGRAVVSGDPILVQDDADATPGRYARDAWGRYKTTRTISLKSEVVYDLGTVGRILSWRERYHCQQRLILQYMVQQNPALRLEEGDVVRLTDSDRSFTTRPCILTEIGRHHQGWVRCGLQALPIDAGTPG